MPTNQSSPWGGGKLRACSNTDSPATMTSVSTHAKTVVATKVPFSQTSLELSRRKDQAKPLSSNVAASALPSRRTAVVSVWENGDGNKTNAQSQFTAVPGGSLNPPQQLNGIQSPRQVLATGQKQAGSSLTEARAPSSSPKKECQSGFNVQLMDTMQKCVRLHTSPPGNSLAVSRRQAAAGDTPSALEPLLSVCHQDLFIRGQPTPLQTNKLMVNIRISFRNPVSVRQ